MASEAKCDLTIIIYGLCRLWGHVFRGWSGLLGLRKLVGSDETIALCRPDPAGKNASITACSCAISPKIGRAAAVRMLLRFYKKIGLGILDSQNLLTKLLFLPVVALIPYFEMAWLLYGFIFKLIDCLTAIFLDYLIAKMPYFSNCLIAPVPYFQTARLLLTTWWYLNYHTINWQLFKPMLLF